MADHIKPLSPEVVAQIRSSSAITSLNGVVQDLLRNSLDARSTKIEVEVDFDRGSCTVRDDGHGIRPDEFKVDGGLGVLYCTSRSEGHFGLTFGRNGAFLALLGDVSLLTITSQHQSFQSQSILTVHRGKVISRLTPTPSRQSFPFKNHGTHVSVRNLFGNLPVRVKQRGLKSEEQNAWYREWEDIKHSTTSLLLGWPSPVQVGLLNSRRNHRVVLRRKGNLLQRVSEDDRPESESIDSTQVRMLLKDAGHIQPLSWESWQSLSASTSGITIRSAISLTPVPTKHIQFISLGIVPLYANGRGSFLYETINNIFAQSQFGIVEDDFIVDETIQKSRPRDEKSKKSLHVKQLGSRRGIDRWPMFFVQLITRKSPTGTTVLGALENEETLAAVSNVLRVMFTAFLEKHHFRPRKLTSLSGKLDSTEALAMNDHNGSKLGIPKSKKLADRESQSSLTPRRRPLKSALPDRGFRESSISSTPKNQIPSIKTSQLPDETSSFPSSNTGNPNGSSMDFSSWSRIKSGRSEFFEKDYHHTKRTKTLDTSGVNSSFFPVGTSQVGLESPVSEKTYALNPKLPKSSHSAPTQSLRQIPQDDSCNQITSKTTVDPVYYETSPLDTDNDGSFSWRDPLSKKVIRVNPRTGQALPRNSTIPQIETVASRGTIESLRKQLKRELRIRKSTDISIESSPAHETPDWVHKFLETWKNPVFAPTEQPIPQSAQCTTIEQSLAPDHVQTCCNNSASSSLSSKISSTRISKSLLKTAEVIAQVDRKFILVKLAGSQDTVPSSISSLILIDQHAADERCRIEDLFSALCEPVASSTSKLNDGECPIETFTLGTPICVQITLQEAKLFQLQAGHFRRWGVIYDLKGLVEGNKGKKQPASIQLAVKSIPPSVAERCKAEPRLLKELLRAEVWKVYEKSDHSGLDKDASGQEAHSNNSWLELIGSCPQGILDMLISRSCRSAIMFNDELTIDQCTMLVRQLADCAFPFQCAHGRPSVIPLVDISNAPGSVINGQYVLGQQSSSNSARPNDFTSVFRTWVA